MVCKCNKKKQNYINSMSIYGRSTSEGDFLKRARTDPLKIIKPPPPGVIILPKDMYKLFNEFQLTQSRLWPIPEYQSLVEDIRSFNRELKMWKEHNGPQIKNLRMTYYFYQNLHSRIIFVNQIASDQSNAKTAIADLAQWLAKQKPKIRGEPPKKLQPSLKPSQHDLVQQFQLNDMNQFNMRKRQMKPYEKMARTAHASFFPPKERLLDYRKKQFIINPKLTIDNDQVREMRLARTSSMKRTNMNNPNLRSTATTFQHTNSNLRQTTITAFHSTKNNFSTKQSARNQIKEVKQPESQQFYKELQIKEFNLQDPNIDPASKQAQQEKAVQQEEELKKMLDEPKYEEDEKDQLEEEEFEEEPQKSKYKKAYEYDHHSQPVTSDIQISQQNIKDHQQSTLRRLLSNKQSQINHKLQDLNVKDKMLTWAKTASFINQQIVRKSQSYRCINNYPRTEYAKKSFFQKRKEIPEFKLHTERAKTTEKLTIRNLEQSCEKKKIQQTLRSFGRYINSHVKINSASPSATQNDEMKMMRATSLTAFNKKDNKKYFGDILAANDADPYNQEAQNDAIHLKERLSKKLMSVNKKKIFSALSAVKTQRLEEGEVFPKVMNLFSNPFFPKHLYETKKKKKKK